MIAKIKPDIANVELDQYEILCSVNKDNLDDFIELLKKEVKKWNSEGWDIPVLITVRNLICITNSG
jgi:hypothetical protein